MTATGLEALKTRHARLLETAREASDPAALVPQIEAFLRDVREAGADVPLGAGRDLLRSLAAYWAGYVFEHSETGRYPSTDLAPYTGTMEPGSEAPRAEAPPLPLPRSLLIALAAILGIALLFIVVPDIISGLLPQASSTPEPSPTSPDVATTPSPSPSRTSSPTPSATPDLNLSLTPPVGIDVALRNVTDGEEIAPELTLSGTYSNLQPGWTIHVLLQPLSQGGRLFPVASFFAVPQGSAASGEWSINPKLGERPEVTQGETYNILQVVALDDQARQALRAAERAGIASFGQLPATVLRLPSVTTVTLGAYDRIAENRVVYSAFLADQQTTELVTVRPDGSDYRQLTFTPLLAEFQPSLSPDGRQIAYVGRERGSEALGIPVSEFVDSLRVMNSDGQNQIVIASRRDARYERPVWSPEEGRYIAYSINAQDGGAPPAGAPRPTPALPGARSWRLVLFDTITGGEVPIATGLVDPRYPAWLPDGSALLFSAAATATESLAIYRYDLTSGEVSLFWDTDAEETQPAVSPDGRELAYLGFPDQAPESNRDIYVVDLVDGEPSGEPRRLTTSTALDWFPAWDPNGVTIYFETFRTGGVQSIWAIEADGTGLRQVAVSQGSNTSPTAGFFSAFLPR